MEMRTGRGFYGEAVGWVGWVGGAPSGAGGQSWRPPAGAGSARLMVASAFGMASGAPLLALVHLLPPAESSFQHMMDGCWKRRCTEAHLAGAR